ncbi:MAG: hypothetical protein ACI9V1_001852 [Spirosomataceae bacterium]|jgi:hypothetical protein
MKKNIAFLFSMIVVLCGLSFTSSAQNCNAIPHPLFEPAPVSKTPVTLNRLGTSPQFGEINGHTAEIAYNHLRGVYSKNSARNKREIDNLLQALGYTGLNDPSFSVASITPETLPVGTTGWMGAYSRGHKYAWSTLGRDFRTFKISSTDQKCFVYIMRKCGNAFYDPSFIPEPPVVIDPAVCLTQKITISGNSKIEKTNFVNTTADVQLVATNGANPSLCLGSTTVPVSVQYGISANGSINYSKVVEVCTYGKNNTPAPISMASPVQLVVDITESNVMLGDGGKMMMAVSDDQYKQMKRLYSTCVTSEGSMNEAPIYTKEETGNRMVESNTTMATSNNTDCKTQTMTFMGSSAVSDGAVKTTSKQVTVIGRYMKAGSLTKGESADKYLCLGTYPMNASLASAFNVSGTSKTMKSLEICDKDGKAPAAMDVNVPITLDYNVSNPTMTMGDSERIFIDLDATQYKTLSKRFGRCCGVEGNDKCI